MRITTANNINSTQVLSTASTDWININSHGGDTKTARSAKTMFTVVTFCNGLPEVFRMVWEMTFKMETKTKTKIRVAR